MTEQTGADASQRISQGCATDTVYRLVTTEEVEAQIPDLKLQS